MKKIIATAALLAVVATAGSANATLVTFDFTNFNPGSGLNTGAMTVAGYTLQLQAWTAQHNTAPATWVTTNMPGSTITWTSGQGLGVANSTAGNSELDTALYNGALGYQDFLSFKLTGPPVIGATYASVTYSGLSASEFSQARINTMSGGVLQSGTAGVTKDQLGTDPSLPTLALNTSFTGDKYLLVGPRLAGLSGFTSGAGNSFLVSAVTLDIPGAVVTPIPAAAWLLGSGLLGLAGLRKRRQ